MPSLEVVTTGIGRQRTIRLHLVGVADANAGSLSWLRHPQPQAKTPRKLSYDLVRKEQGASHREQYCPSSYIPII